MSSQAFRPASARSPILAAVGISLTIGLGAVLGLWAVVAVGILAGAKLVERVPLGLVRRITGVILVVLGVISGVAAIRG